MPDIEAMLRAEQEQEASGNLDAIANGEWEKITPEEKMLADKVEEFLEFRGTWHSTRGRNGGDDRRERMIVCDLTDETGAAKEQFRQWEPIIEETLKSAQHPAGLYAIAFIPSRQYSDSTPEERKELELSAVKEAKKMMRKSAVDMLRGILISEEESEDA